jgi:hypothetical protein
MDTYASLISIAASVWRQKIPQAMLAWWKKWPKRKINEENRTKC